MLDMPAGQTQYGSTEGVVIDGSSVSPMLTWDSKITTVIGMLGGFADAVTRGLDEEGLLFQFYDVVNTEWSKKFPTINGLDVDFALPNFKPA